VSFDYVNQITHIYDYIRDTPIASSGFTGPNQNVTSFLAINGTYSWTGYNNNYMSINEFNWTTPTTTASGASSNPFSNSAMIVSACSTSGFYYSSSLQYLRWIVGRTMPPNDIEPSVTIGNVQVVPEFPSIIIFPAFIAATLLAVVVYRRKNTPR
jgi:hypothetical protein